MLIPNEDEFVVKLLTVLFELNETGSDNPWETSNSKKCLMGESETDLI